MYQPLKHPRPTTVAGGVELFDPYHDYPTMASSQANDSAAASPALRPAGFNNGTDPGRPPHLSFRSSVPLLPTPGTVSKRHPTFVRRRFGGWSR